MSKLEFFYIGSKVNPESFFIDFTDLESIHKLVESTLIKYGYPRSNIAIRWNPNGERDSYATLFSTKGVIAKFRVSDVSNN